MIALQNLVSRTHGLQPAALDDGDEIDVAQRRRAVRVAITIPAALAHREDRAVQVPRRRRRRGWHSSSSSTTRKGSPKSARARATRWR